MFECSRDELERVDEARHGVPRDRENRFSWFRLLSSAKSIFTNSGNLRLSFRATRVKLPLPKREDGMRNEPNLISWLLKDDPRIISSGLLCSCRCSPRIGE